MTAHGSDIWIARGHRPRLQFSMLRILSIVLISILSTSCSRPPEVPLAARKGCIQNFDSSTDYFPDKTQVEFAQNFSVTYHNSYKVVTVRLPADGNTEERYVLLQCGAPRPSPPNDLSGAPIITVPITSLFSAASAHMPLLVDLGHVDVLA